MRNREFTSKIKYLKLCIHYHSAYHHPQTTILSKYPLSWIVYVTLLVFFWPPCSPYTSSSCPINIGVFQGSVLSTSFNTNGSYPFLAHSISFENLMRTMDCFPHTILPILWPENTHIIKNLGSAGELRWFECRLIIPRLLVRLPHSSRSCALHK